MKINLQRDNTKMEEGYYKGAENYYFVYTKATTLKGINEAYKRAFGDDGWEYAKESDLEKDIANGYIAFFADGYVLYYL